MGRYTLKEDALCEFYNLGNVLRVENADYIGIRNLTIQITDKLLAFRNNENKFKTSREAGILKLYGKNISDAINIALPILYPETLIDFTNHFLKLCSDNIKDPEVLTYVKKLKAVEITKQTPASTSAEGAKAH